MKQCSRCQEHKAPTEFYANITQADGLSYWCKECTKDRSGNPQSNTIITRMRLRAKMLIKKGYSEEEAERKAKLEFGV